MQLAVPALVWCSHCRGTSALNLHSLSLKTLTGPSLRKSQHYRNVCSHAVFLFTCSPIFMSTCRISAAPTNLFLSRSNATNASQIWQWSLKSILIGIFFIVVLIIITHNIIYHTISYQYQFTYQVSDFVILRCYITRHSYWTGQLL